MSSLDASYNAENVKTRRFRFDDKQLVLRFDDLGCDGRFGRRQWQRHILRGCQ